MCFPFFVWDHMERIISTSRAYLVEIGTLLQVVRSWFFILFPFFIYPKQLEHFKLDYKNKKDYLFLPELMSTKKYIYPETISLSLTLLVLFVLFVYVLTQLFTVSVLVVFSGAIALFYASFLVFKLYVIYVARSFSFIDSSKEEIDAISDDSLPVYTIFLPLKYEAEVIGQIVKAIESIDYPREKLNILVPLEEYDHETIDALKNANLPPYYHLSYMPFIEPQTKPKTMNFAFDQIRGEYFVIYDAEIIPDRDQLKKAHLAFKKFPDIACLQTRLDHYNTDQNILTRLFNMEYTFYYDFFLPGLQKLGFPIPLSGHSTHFRIDALRDMGGWDPYNVTEDCEIGMRLYRRGYKAGILNSISREEAASTLWSWIKQRTRWMKGFVQTTIVHLRHPFRFKKEIGGWKNFFAFLFTVPGTVLLNFLNLFSWVVLVIWIVTNSALIKEWYPGPILYLSTATFIIGSFAFAYLNLVSSYHRKHFHLIKYGLLTPFYWFLLAIATTRALLQIIFSPANHGWEKTTHGTHLTGGRSVL